MPSMQMKRPKNGVLAITIATISIFFSTEKFVYVASTSPSPPTNHASPSITPSQLIFGDSGNPVVSAGNEQPSNNSNEHGSQGMRPQQEQQQFLMIYELYEHEIYNPSTDSWAAKRFTQSPIAGGGGRDSISLDPLTCAAPRGTAFDGEWKIDMTGSGETRDGFGWEYYVGQYDGLGRRRRRWLRTLKRVARAKPKSVPASRKSKSNVGASRLKSSDQTPSQAASKKVVKKDSESEEGKQKKTSKKSYLPKQSISTFIQDQYNFKGFGWSLNKSFISRRAFGTSFRIPLSANFDFYDQHMAWPVISSSSYFGYPWVAATFLNASLPVEAVKWVIGSVMYKWMWSLAVVSAVMRCVAEAIFNLLMLPWRVWKVCAEFVAFALRRIFNIFAVFKSKEEKMARSLMKEMDAKRDGEEEESTDEEDANRNGSQTKNLSTEVEGNIVDGFIELSSPSSGDTEMSTANGKDDETSMSDTASAVANTPRGGASSKPIRSSSPRKKYLTLSGNEVPPFRRSTPIQYSSTVNERIGVCISWRVSKERGYEYRWNFFYTCLPTLHAWGLVEQEVKRRMKNALSALAFWNKVIEEEIASQSKKIEAKDTTRHSSSTSRRHSFLSRFFEEHNASLGMSAGFPVPFDPYFVCGLVLSLNGFYYSWLLKYFRTLRVKEISSNESASSTKSSETNIEKGAIKDIPRFESFALTKDSTSDKTAGITSIVNVASKAATDDIDSSVVANAAVSGSNLSMQDDELDQDEVVHSDGETAEAVINR